MAARRNPRSADVHEGAEIPVSGSTDLTGIASRILAGDVGAFALVVESTSDALVRLAARLMGSVADGEDVVQDAYLKAYRGLCEGRFDGRAHLRTWLGRIVVNTALDSLRSRKRAPAPRENLPDAGDAAASAESRAALSELDDWLATLPPEQRVAIVLKSVEGYTSAEIARALGCSEGAVEQRLVRARTSLRRRMPSS